MLPAESVLLYSANFPEIDAEEDCATLLGPIEQLILLHFTLITAHSIPC